MTVSGGTTKTNYMFSAGYLSEEGLVKSTSFERYLDVPIWIQKLLSGSKQD